MDGTSGSYISSVYSKRKNSEKSCLTNQKGFRVWRLITYHLLYGLKGVLHLNTFVTYSVGYYQRLQLKLLALLGCCVTLSLFLDSPVLFPSVREGSWERSSSKRHTCFFVFISTLSLFKWFCMYMLQFYFDLLNAVVCSFVVCIRFLFKAVSCYKSPQVGTKASSEGVLYIGTQFTPFIAKGSFIFLFFFYIYFQQWLSVHI